MPAAIGDGSTRSAGPLISAEMCHNSLARLGVTVEPGSSPSPQTGKFQVRTGLRRARHPHGGAVDDLDQQRRSIGERAFEPDAK